MNNSVNISVIGAGSWGTALAIILSRKGYSVKLWGRDKTHVELLEKHRENRRYLSGCLFPEQLSVDNDLSRVVHRSNIVVMVIPSHGFRNVFSEIVEFLETDVKVVSAVKGIENGSLKTMTEVMNDVINSQNKSQKNLEIGVLSGPSFAKEVAKNIPTAVTIGFKNIKTAENIQKIFASPTFRVYASNDIIGLEISAALKNIIAIATGVCDSLEYGLNTRAALITRGLAEMRRLGICLGASPETFAGLSGMGDLILTCTGDLSRNRTVGLKLGKGKKVAQITSEMSMVAEGIKTTLSGYDLAKKHEIEMPILEQVYNIIYNNKDCSLAVSDLLEREMKEE